MPIQIQLRRGTLHDWYAANPVLAEGELGLESDTMKFKIGDGTTQWNSLGYSTGVPGPILPAFTYQGILALYTGDARFYMDREGIISLIRISLGVPATGTGGTSVATYVNGALIGTVTIPAGLTNYTATISPGYTVYSGDYITHSITGITSGGTTGQDLTVQVSIN